ncbi:MAG: helix-turn-helix domain-containing protein [Phycisphaerales bacterium]
MTVRADSAPQSGPESPEQSQAPLNSDPERARHALPRLLTLTEAARLLRVHRNTVDRERKAGRLAAVRVGRRVLVRADQLQRYVEEGTEQWSEFSSTKLTGWSGERTHRHGTSTGADRARDGSCAAARAQATLRTPSGD